MRGECLNVNTPCAGDWDDVDSLCVDCRIERECVLIDAAIEAAMDAAINDAAERDTSDTAEAHS